MIKKLKTLYKKIWQRLLCKSTTYPSYPPTDPVTKRNDKIKEYETIINRKLNESIEKIKNNEDFQNFLNNTASVDSSSTTQSVIDWDEFIKAVKNVPSYQAQLIWTINHIVGNQNVNIFNDDNPTAYYLTYNYDRDEVSDEDNIKKMRLEVISEEATDKDYISFTHNTYDIFKYYNKPLIMDISKAIVETNTRHYVYYILHELLDISINNQAEHAHHTAPTFITLNMVANDIARAARRGAGNYMVIDTNDVSDLYINSKNNKVDISKCNLFDDIYQSEYFKYEFTLHGIIKVFSSNMFSDICKEKNLTNVNVLMGYNGDPSTSNVDTALAFIIDKYENWEVVDDVESEHSYHNANSIILKRLPKNLGLSKPEKYVRSFNIPFN